VANIKKNGPPKIGGSVPSILSSYKLARILPSRNSLSYRKPSTERN